MANWYMGGNNRHSFNDNMNEMPRPNSQRDFSNKRYSDAYGDYRGGYGQRQPSLGFDPGPGLDFWSRPTHPPFIMGRGFGPGGPPVKKFAHDDRPIKYLLRCGVTKENLKNLPRKLLQLIEPQHCGICNQRFDSYPSSRVHYTSKSHMKNQMRWLNQTTENTVIHKEAPLKSRDLYCELCEVQITSKMHAESHYSGRSHKSIVEGRKNPKNALLCQEDMAERLQNLIRREKRYIYNNAEIKPSASQEKPQDDKKVISPELYCSICKTCVSSSEQMTMHLNGKRHLSKEKQHILKVMKMGVIPTNVRKQEEDEEEVEVLEDNTETQEDDSAAIEKPGDNKVQSEDDDWGKGGSSWDEPTNQ